MYFFIDRSGGRNVSSPSTSDHTYTNVGNLACYIRRPRFRPFHCESKIHAWEEFLQVRLLSNKQTLRKRACNVSA
jgi:hypothetical protein